MISINPFKLFGAKKKSCDAGSSGSAVFAANPSSFVTGRGISNREAMRLYASTTVVSSPINLISDSLSTVIPVMLDPSGEVVKEHPALDIINNPSAFESKTSLLVSLSRYFLITGDSEYTLTGNISFPPGTIIPLNPSDVTVYAASDGYPGRYIVTGDKGAGEYKREKASAGREIFIASQFAELGHIRGFSVQTGGQCTEGQSPLMQASPEAKQHIESLSFNLSALMNGGSLSMLFNLKGDIDEDDFKELSEKIRATYGGARNSGKIAVLADADATVEEFGASLKDMQYQELTNSARDSVATAYKVPLPLINQSASTFNNYSAAQEALWTHAVIPLADVIFGNLTSTILPRFKNMDGWRYWFDVDSIPALKDARNRQFDSRTRANVETPDELRELIGRPAIPGGDQLLRPASLVPISDLEDAGEPEVAGDGE